MTRILIPVSVNPPKHHWRVGNTFDLYSPRYAFYYDHVEVFGWYENAGPHPDPTGWPGSVSSIIATKPRSTTPVGRDARVGRLQSLREPGREAPVPAEGLPTRGRRHALEPRRLPRVRTRDLDPVHGRERDRPLLPSRCYAHRRTASPGTSGRPPLSRPAGALARHRHRARRLLAVMERRGWERRSGSSRRRHGDVGGVNIRHSASPRTAASRVLRRDHGMGRLRAPARPAAAFRACAGLPARRPPRRAVRTSQHPVTLGAPTSRGTCTSSPKNAATLRQRQASRSNVWCKPRICFGAAAEESSDSAGSCRRPFDDDYFEMYRTPAVAFSAGPCWRLPAAVGLVERVLISDRLVRPDSGQVVAYSAHPAAAGAGRGCLTVCGIGVTIDLEGNGRAEPWALGPAAPPRSGRGRRDARRHGQRLARALPARDHRPREPRRRQPFEDRPVAG